VNSVKIHDERYQGLIRWLGTLWESGPLAPGKLGGDASFRRYYRLSHHATSYIAMDCPPQHENAEKFVSIARLFASLGIQVPGIKAANHIGGYLLLSDMGDTTLWNMLSHRSDIDGFYRAAIDVLLRFQTKYTGSVPALPVYNRQMLVEEMRLFPDWYVEKYLDCTLSERDRAELEGIMTIIADQALLQPQVLVHRDYHSRNLMVLPDHSLGVLDFQDAVVGPVTYDLVSLLRDCYVYWPDARVEEWRRYYLDQAHQLGMLPGVGEVEFLDAFTAMGLQRHLKVAGIFARLWLRDGKAGYLKDIPLTIRYLLDATPQNSRWADLGRLLRRLPHKATS